MPNAPRPVDFSKVLPVVVGVLVGSFGALWLLGGWPTNTMEEPAGAAESSSCELSSLLWTALQTPGHPIAYAWLLCKGAILLTFGTSLLTGNYSQVDKLWSILPFLYAWLLVPASNDKRTLLMAILATVWGLRLTYNFNRRGGYHWPPWRGEEDYRWAYLQNGFFIPALANRAVWHVFHFVFISVFQNMLLLLIVTPSMVAGTAATHEGCFDTTKTARWNVLDGIATVLFLSFLLLESVADNQQYAFQTEKYRLLKRENDPMALTGDHKDGYLQSGLYAWMRKPNYTGEQGIWVSYYIFSVASLWSTTTTGSTGTTEAIFNCSIVGCTMLILLFQGSGYFTEVITLSKYPHYKEYQQRVPLYLPNPFSSGTGRSTTGTKRFKDSLILIRERLVHGRRQGE